MVQGGLDSVRFRDFNRSYLLVRRTGARVTGRWIPVEARRAARIVAWCVSEDPRLVSRIRGGLGRARAIPARDRDLAEFLQRGLIEGPSLLLFVHAHQAIAKGRIIPEPAPAALAPPEPIVETQWLRVILRDEHDEPVADVGFEVELEDGSVHTGRTDAAGEGYLYGLAPGRASIRWPDLHPDDWASY